MKNTKDFLNQLDKLTFVEHEDKTLHTAEGFQIVVETLAKIEFENLTQ